MKTRIMVGILTAGMLTAFQAGAAPVNINKADAATLAESLNGVGPVTSRQIVNYREENGGFDAPEDLMNVDGIGQVTFDNNKQDVLVGE